MGERCGIERMELPPLAVSATFTAESIEEALAFWIRELDWRYEIRFAPYNQVFQQLLDPASLLARNRNGVNLVLVRLEDLSAGGAATALEDNVRHLVSALGGAAQSFRAPSVVAICPASPRFLSDPQRASLQARMEDVLGSSLAASNTIHLLTPAELHELYPVPHYDDPHGEELGHVPYTSAFFAALATALVRKIHALRMTPYKVIVLDCDETLWQGVCGEDGPQGVCLDAPRRALQEFMVKQYEAGMLLCLCSKNNEEDVLETFRAHPEMPLRLDHFVARRINWESKSANLTALAEELNLGLDSFLFVDDNPAECAEVEAHCPDVLTLPLPSEPERIPRFLRHIWAFDRLRITAEDRHRSALYAQEIARGRLEKKAATLEEFLAALKLEIRIGPMTADQLPRVAQLTHRTNQMNFTSIRRSESDLQALLSEGRAECLTVDVRDRFGSYGLVGVVLFETRAEALAVDTFLLSCRALGRGVEHRMLARLGAIARECGIPTVEAPFAPSARNSPALAFLRSCASVFEERTESGLLFRFPAEHAAQTVYKPANHVQAPSVAARAAPSATRREATDFVRIATELSDARQVLRQIRARRDRSSSAASPSDAPRTALEKQLAEIWAELLDVPEIGVHDNFFDLGGHSLLAVQLLSRVRQVLEVDLSLELVYRGPFTVAEMAKEIDLREIERAGSAQYAEVLRELEGLTEEEIRALLAEAQGDGPA